MVSGILQPQRFRGTVSNGYIKAQIEPSFFMAGDKIGSGTAFEDETKS